MQKVLITGGAGFMGYHLANRLAEDNLCVDIIDSFDRGVKDEEFSTLINKNNVRFFQKNILDNNFVYELDVDYDCIFHFAAIIGVANVLNLSYSVLRDNIRMLDNMLQLAAKQKANSRFLFTSTSEVYAGTLKYFDLTIPTPETTPLAITDLTSPRTSYMLSKIYGEAMCQQSGVEFTIFRPHNVYGPRMGMAHVIPELFKRSYEAQDNQKLDVYSPEHTRTFCYIDDALEIMIRSAQPENCINQTMNLGTQEPEITMRDLAKIIIGITGKELEIKDMPTTEGSPKRRCPDMQKTNELIGYNERVSLNEGIRKTYNWYREHIFEGHEITAR